jgi:hypothetical protein
MKCKNCNMEFDRLIKFKKHNERYCKKCHYHFYYNEIRKYKEKDVAARIKSAAKCQDKQRVKLMEMINGGIARCKYCGCDELRFLEFNHINGGGNIQYKKYKLTFQRQIVLGLIDIKELEITCRVCNHLKFLETKNPDQAKRFKITWS